MADAIIVLNAGSSSLRFSVFRAATDGEVLCRGLVEGLPGAARFTARDGGGRVAGERSWAAGPDVGHLEAVEHVFAWGRAGGFGDHRIVAAGHRVVHGGTAFSRPVRVDGPVLAALTELIPLAPLHQPHNVAAIHAVARLEPGLPQVACFDTSFHRTAPAVAQAFALPRRLAAEGLRRYGFHGLSYEYVAAALPAVDAAAAAGRTVVAHLGNGASMCALRAGVSVATTMGFTAMDGLVMGTRCGALDPGVILHLLNRCGMDARDVEQMLYERSGLLGVSDISSDMRTLLSSGDPRAAEAVDLFVYRIGREIGSLAAALGGLDALVFTGGIGENAPSIRARVCRDAEWLGLSFDPEANEAGAVRISTPDSRVGVWVLPTHEELMIARHALRLLAG